MLSLEDRLDAAIAFEALYRVPSWRVYHLLERWFHGLRQPLREAGSMVRPSVLVCSWCRRLHYNMPGQHTPGITGCKHCDAGYSAGDAAVEHSAGWQYNAYYATYLRSSLWCRCTPEQQELINQAALRLLRKRRAQEKQDAHNSTNAVGEKCW